MCRKVTTHATDGRVVYLHAYRYTPFVADHTHHACADSGHPDVLRMCRQCLFHVDAQKDPDKVPRGDVSVFLARACKQGRRKGIRLSVRFGSVNSTSYSQDIFELDLATRQSSSRLLHH